MKITIQKFVLAAVASTVAIQPPLFFSEARAPRPGENNGNIPALQLPISESQKVANPSLISHWRPTCGDCRNAPFQGEKRVKAVNPITPSPAIFQAVFDEHGRVRRAFIAPNFSVLPFDSAHNAQLPYTAKAAKSGSQKQFGAVELTDPAARNAPIPGLPSRLTACQKWQKPAKMAKNGHNGRLYRLTRNCQKLQKVNADVAKTQHDVSKSQHKAEGQIPARKIFQKFSGFFPGSFNWIVHSKPPFSGLDSGENPPRLYDSFRRQYSRTRREIRRGLLVRSRVYTTTIVHWFFTHFTHFTNVKLGNLVGL